MRLLFLFVFLLFSMVSGKNGTSDVIDFSQLVNCSDLQSVFLIEQKCFEENGVTFKLPSLSEINNSSGAAVFSSITPGYLDDMCSYGKAAVCVGNINRKCFKQTDTDTTADTIKKSQEYICANKDKFNFTCMVEVMPKLRDCSDARSYMTTNDNLNLNFTEQMDKLGCMSAQMSSLCARKYMSACGEASLHFYETDGLNSTDCSSFATGPDITSVDCSTTENIRSSYYQCLMYNSVLLDVPKQLTSEGTSHYIMNAMAMSESKTMCSNLKNYQLAVNCTLWVQEQCSDHVTKPMVADSQTVQDGLAKLCGHIGDFDTQCVQNAPKAACGSGHGLQALDSTSPGHLCAATSAAQKCLVSAVRGCSKTTVSMYEDLLRSQSPSVCLTAGSVVIG
ncbi:uncharacterized protein LOC124135834 isoform X2 [Haliotis rufescens]|uniref:uncharacterized protein LOC124135834 isoform X2 n=1 Tax=Haliotis rufescens TaxID=6454 RepID=UPI001EAFDBEB|nr:uncharacterized protein LOC124135834 isoform X2 [Haliotis rufescens]